MECLWHPEAGEGRRGGPDARRVSSVSLMLDLFTFLLLSLYLRAAALTTPVATGEKTNRFLVQTLWLLLRRPDVFRSLFTGVKHK